MNKEIYDIVLKSSSEDKLLSKSNMEDIFEIIRDENNLKDYCNAINLCELPGKIIGWYRKGSKKIDVDYDKAILREYSNYFESNLMLLEIIIHEIEHAKQHKIINSNANDKYGFIEKVLLACCYNIYRLNSQPAPWPDSDIKYLEKLGIERNENTILKLLELQNSLYRYAPNERMAEINSFYQLKKMLEGYGDPEEVLDKINLSFNRQLIRGYQKTKEEQMIIPPSYRFLAGMGFDSIIPIIKKLEKDHFDYPQYNLYRMLYGLNVDEEFLNKKTIKVKNLEKKEK